MKPSHLNYEYQSKHYTWATGKESVLVAANPTYLWALAHFDRHRSSPNVIHEFVSSLALVHATLRSIAIQ
jgi:hypothetical protein